MDKKKKRRITKGIIANGNEKEKENDSIHIHKVGNGAMHYVG